METVETVNNETSLLQELSKALQCQICTDTMTTPFVLSCGHSFCYSCAYQWLRSHRTCPACRKRIRSKPVLVYSLKDVSSILSRHRSGNLSNSTTVDVLRGLSEKEQIYKDHSEEYFPGLFRELGDHISGGRLQDTEDRVTRCIRCYWEIEGSECR